MRRDESVERILAEWQEQRASGETTPPEEVIAAHPDCADQLRARFRALRALDPTLDLPPGAPERIGEFRILREIDRGGMGVVYEAEQTSMRRKVALKVLSPLITTTPRAVKRFQREAQAAGRLHHTNIVPIHGLGQHAGYWYYAMELVQGQPLSTAIDELRAAARRPTERSLARVAADAPSTLTPGTGTGTRAYYLRVAEMFAGVAEALQLAHAEGVVHRDIKPSNLLLDADGTLKIVDFGLARIAQEGPAMTVTGDLLGTPAYMSPEQAAGTRDAIDHRTDVYSLGATLYEVLALKPPFRAKDLAALCAQIARRDPVALRRLDRRVPRDLETIVLKAMEKEPRRRYESAGELARDLRRFAEGQPIGARRVGPLARTWRRVKRHRTVSILVVGVLVAALLGMHFARRAAEEGRRARELEYSRLCALAGAATGRSQSSPEPAVNPDVTLCVDPGVQLSEDARHPGWAARDLYSHAIDVLPERPEAYVGRALVPGQGRDARYADLDEALARGLSRRTWHLARAHFLGLERRFDEAQREREAAAALSGETPADAYCEATVLTLIGELELATQLLSRAIEGSRAGDAVHSLALRARIRARIRMRDDEGALADLHALRDAGARDIPLLVCLAGTWRRLGRLERSEVLFEEAIAGAARDGSRAAWMELCQATRAHGTNEEYLRVTEAALAAHPDRVEMMRERANALLESKRLDESLEICERARAASPRAHAVNETMASILNTLARRPEALAAIDAALEADPECPTACNRRGSILLGSRRFEDARDAFREAVRLDPAFARAHHNLGLVFRKTHRFDDALRAFEDALRVDPHLVEAYVSRGAMRADDLGQPDAALEDFDQAIAIDASNATPHANRGIVLERRGELEQARAAYARAVGLAPGVLDHRLKFWRVMRKLGQLDELAADRARIIEEAADDPSMRLVRARALLASERFEDALAAVEAALAEEPRSTALRFEKAVALEHLHRLEETVIALDDLIALDPMLAVAHSNRALMLAKLGRLDEALESNTRALEVDPELAGAMSDRGLIFRYMGRLDEALEAYRKATEIERDSVRAHSLMAYHLNWLGRHEEAVEWARRAVELDPGSAHAHSNLATNLAACGRHAEALDVWDKTLRLAPLDAEAHANRALSLRGLGRLDEALAAARKAIDLDADCAEAYRALGRIAAERGDPGAAIEAYEKAVGLDPNDFQAFGALAALHLEAGRLDRAESIASRAIEASPKVPWLYYERARIRLTAERREEALEDIETAVDMAPKDAQCHNLHGLCLRALGRHEEALEAYRKAVAIDARQPEALGNIAGLLVDELGQLDEGLEATEKWLAVDPDDPWAHNLKGWVFWRTHRFDEAIPCYRRGLELAPRHAFLIRNLAMVLNAKERYDEALEVLAPLDEVQPVLARSYGEQGYALCHTGRHKESADAFRRAIAIQPNERPAYRRLIDVLLELREAEPAWRVCVEARRRWPDGTGFQRRQVTALRMLGKHDLAREQAQEFTARKSDRKDLDFAQLCAVAGKREEALAELERWRDEETHWARYRGAVVYAILGDHDRAIEWLREGLDRGLYLPPASPPDPELEVLKTHAAWAALARRLHERRAPER